MSDPYTGLSKQEVLELVAIIRFMADAMRKHGSDHLKEAARLAEERLDKVLEVPTR